MEREIAGFPFKRVCDIEPQRDPSGAVVRFMPQERYANTRKLRLHRNGAGPFCAFTAARGIAQSGVYVLTVEDEPVYAGKCQNLAERFGPRGYGVIHPRNCYDGGQSTNCKVNNLVLHQADRGLRITLWFHAASLAATVERHVILAVRPA